jgi:hypothetical protein
MNSMFKSIHRLGLASAALTASTGTLLAQAAPNFDDMPQPGAGGGIAALFILVIQVALIAVMIAAMWKIFTKAGQPGWASLIPIYNIYILTKIAGRPAWWLLLLLIPFANFIILIILTVDLSKRFGKGTGYAIGMILLPFIFYPMLGFGDDKYEAPAA